MARGKKLQLAPPPVMDESEVSWQRWFYSIFDRIKPGPFMLPAYTKSNLPSAEEWCDNTNYTSIIAVTDDATSGFCLAVAKLKSSSPDVYSWYRVDDPTQEIA